MTDLEAMARLSVFFGHQSVGANVLDGLQSLAAREGVTLSIEHTTIGANGDPAGKMAAFQESLDAARRRPDVAMMKLCYVDFAPATDATALFARYRSTIRELEARHPGVTFVHVTTPLHASQGYLKTLLKRALGRVVPESVNAVRERYNALLRKAYQGKEPVFDLARLESTRPDGRPEISRHGGEVVPMLVPAYTDDGGHLNAEGRERAARALAQVLASVR